MACVKFDEDQEEGKDEILKRAIEVGALALKFSLEANNGSNGHISRELEGFREMSSFVEI